jgi:ketosteroid isomerase-like protein
MPEQNLATVRRFWSSIGNKDVEGYLSTFAEGGVAFDPVDRPPLRTSDERRQFMQELLAGFSEIQVAIDYVTECGNSTAAKWTVTGLAPSGERLRIEGIDTYEHAPDGRIEQMRGFFQV